MNILLVLSILAVFYFFSAVLFQTLKYGHDVTKNPFRWINYLLVIGQLCALIIYLSSMLMTKGTSFDNSYVRLARFTVLIWSVPILVVYSVLGYMLRNMQVTFYLSALMASTPIVVCYFLFR